MGLGGITMSWKKILKEDKKLRCEIKRSPNCTGKAEFIVSDMKGFLGSPSIEPKYDLGKVIDGAYSCRNCLASDDGGFESTFDSVVEI
jgi:hypothetical protein